MRKLAIVESLGRTVNRVGFKLKNTALKFW